MKTIISCFLVFILLPHWSFSETQDTCVYTETDVPPYGACAGPIHRAAARYAFLDYTNPGCGAGQVRFYPDGDTSGTVLCGECVPGTSGLDSTTCGKNEYCEDSGVCQDLESHPLLDHDCPYDLGHESSSLWCGPGLRCIKHKCSVCEEGVVDPADGKICYDGKWTYSKWDTMFTDPEATFILIVLILIGLFVLISLVPKSLFCKKKKDSKDQKKKEKKHDSDESEKEEIDMDSQSEFEYETCDEDDMSEASKEKR